MVLLSVNKRGVCSYDKHNLISAGCCGRPLFPYVVTQECRDPPLTFLKPDNPIHSQWLILPLRLLMLERIINPLPLIC